MCTRRKPVGGGGGLTERGGEGEEEMAMEREGGAMAENRRLDVVTFIEK